MLKYHGQLLLESQSEADERAQMSVEEAISLQCDIETLKDHISFAEAEEKQVCGVRRGLFSGIYYYCVSTVF